MATTHAFVLYSLYWAEGGCLLPALRPWSQISVVLEEMQGAMQWHWVPPGPLPKRHSDVQQCRDTSPSQLAMEH